MAAAKAFLLAFLLGISQGLLAQESGRLSKLEAYLLKASALDLHHQVLDSAPVAYRLGLSTPEFHKIYGWALYNTNQPLSAATQYRKALSQNSLDTVARLGLYQALRDGGEQHEAHFYRGKFRKKDNGSQFVSIEGILATGDKPNYGQTFIPDSFGSAQSAWQSAITGLNVSGQWAISNSTFLSLGFSQLSVTRSSWMQGIELVLQDSDFIPPLGRFNRNYVLDTISNVQQMGVTQNQGMIHLSQRIAKNLFFQAQYQLINIQSTFQELGFRQEAFQFQPFDPFPSFRVRHDFTFKTETFQDHVLLAGFNWRFKNIKWMVTGGLRSFYGSNAPLLNVELLWKVFGNSGLYVMPAWNTDFTTTVASIQLGARILPGTWLEGQFFYGNLTGTATNSGAIVWNLPDNTNRRFTLSLLKRLGNWGEWNLRYGYTELEAYRIAYRAGFSEKTDYFNYALHSFVTGFKFFF